MAGTGGNLKELYIICKTTQIDLNNDNVLNDDSDLFYSVFANELIHFQVEAYYVAGAGGIQAAMSGPAAYTALNYSASLDIAGATKVTSNVATAWDVTVTQAAGSQGLVRISGYLHNGANAANLVFRWAQNTSNGANTSVYQGSRLKVFRCL